MAEDTQFWRVRVSSASEKLLDDLLLELMLPDDSGGPIDCRIRCETGRALANIYLKHLRKHGPQ